MSLKEALSVCAEEGEKSRVYIWNMIDFFKRSSTDMSNSIKRAIENMENTDFKNQEIKKELVKQLSFVKESLTKRNSELTRKFNDMSKNQADFSITLFGKTTAGKSTLYEILTEGDGSSIGKGKPRETRDPRTYCYKEKGLQITDVPGIGAFKGEDDEAIAIEAARNSNLILFLMETKTEFQSEDAEWLNKVVNLGKPVVLLVNVKEETGDIKNKKAFEIFEEKLQKRFNPQELAERKNYIIEHGAKHFGQDWSNIKFANAHLLAAFLSQQKSNPAEMNEKLYALSNFKELEDSIIGEVMLNGPFYKQKAYADIVAVDFTEALDEFFVKSAETNLLARRLIKKRNELKEWLEEEFKPEVRTEIEETVDSIDEDLLSEVGKFVGENHENFFTSKTEKEWNKIIEKENIDKKIETILQKSQRNCVAKLNEIRKKALKEVEVLYDKPQTSRNKKWPRYFPLQKAVNAVRNLAYFAMTRVRNPYVAVVSSLLTVTAGALDWFIDENYDEDKKKKCAEELRSGLEETIEKNMITILKGSLKSFKEKIESRADETLKVISESTNILFRLADRQFELARKINNELYKLNSELIGNALRYKGYNGLESHIDKIARIPGNEWAIFLHERDNLLPVEERKKLEKEISALLQENIHIFNKSDSLKYMIDATMHKKFEKNDIEIEKINGEPRIWHTDLRNRYSDNMRILNRIKMVQQATELLIMEVTGGSNDEK